VSGDRLLGIGAFSVLSGLSIAALRHYDAIGLLPPFSVDARSAYRRYATEQIATARLIRTLRSVELPTTEIRQIVEAADGATTQAMLLGHRARMAERLRATKDIVETLTNYIENGVPMTSTTRLIEVNIGVDDLEAARRFYETVFRVELTEERHGDGPLHLVAVFGAWPSDEFFLLNLSDAAHDRHRAGRANFGFLVDDLEAAHQRAVAAGGTEIGPPEDLPGMPRTSSVIDPGGNLIHLYQNV
jgi:DNA-binding transcriptional MerR regulator